MDGERVVSERIDEIAKGLTAFSIVQSGRYLRLLAKEVQDRRASDRKVKDQLLILIAAIDSDTSKRPNDHCIINALRELERNLLP